jgi:hypothetical protein
MYTEYCIAVLLVCGMLRLAMTKGTSIPYRVFLWVEVPIKGSLSHGHVCNSFS